MPPLPPIHLTPKVVLYHQTHHTRVEDAPNGDDGQLRPVSVLPLLGPRRDTTADDDGDCLESMYSGPPSITHLVVAAFHINAPSDANPLSLNDHAPDDARFDVLWAEVAALQRRGVRVLGLLGGAAKGSFARLDVGGGVSASDFAAAYGLFAAAVRRHRLDGVDLDVEESMTLQGVIHLLDRLRADFGPAFLLTLSPVAAALLRPDDPRCNLSGFSYAALERARGSTIAWYHAQFYCGWGDAAHPDMYAAMTRPQAGAGAFLPPHRVVMGLVTNPANGSGFVPLETLSDVVLQLRGDPDSGLPGVGDDLHSAFGGVAVAGWEYFNALPGGAAKPWDWASLMAALLAPTVVADGQAGNLQSGAATTDAVAEVDPDAADGPDAPVPTAFAYCTDDEE